MAKKILVAEDYLKQRNRLSELLQQQGYEVVARADGLEAWEAFVAAGNFNLVVTDGTMPNWDGYDLAKQIRAVSAVPVILLSFGLDTVRLPSYITAGLSKPYEDKDLLALVRKHLP
jgi:CheY-like chemotaxis protein